MGFASVDDLINEITTNGKIQRLPFLRVIQTGATSVAGRWHECFSSDGTGGLGSLSGSSGVGFAVTGGLPQPVPAVTPDTKHLLNWSAVSGASTLTPAYLMLTDLLYCYPACVVSSGAGSTLNNGAGKPTRFNNGVGVQCSALVTSALGAATPTITVAYTNQAGTGGRSGTIVSAANSHPVGVVMGGGVAGATQQPVMTLAAGDSGVRQLDSYTTSSGTTGAVALVLHRPIATLPIVAQSTAGERDFLNQLPALPVIPDDAVLAFFVLIGGALTANQSFYGELTMGWG